jgi:hypothetical protein
MIKNAWLLAIVMLLGLWSGCQQDAASLYKQRERRELASGLRYDSLFLGITFGMTSKAFYTHCWDMNKAGVIKEGPNNSTVQYYIPNVEPPIRMLFYPNFHEDRIYEMPITFNYVSWSPWNKDLYADKLQLKIVEVLEDWYGEGFIRLDHPKGGALYAKIDGNRRISVWCEDDEKVKALITDLPASRRIPKTEGKLSSK